MNPRDRYTSPNRLYSNPPPTQSPGGYPPNRYNSPYNQPILPSGRESYRQSVPQGDQYYPPSPPFPAPVPGPPHRDPYYPQNYNQPRENPREIYDPPYGAPPERLPRYPSRGNYTPTPARYTSPSPRDIYQQSSSSQASPPMGLQRSTSNRSYNSVPRQATSAPPGRPSLEPQSKVDSDQEAVRVALIISKQEDEFGTNMFEEISNLDEPYIADLMERGYTRTDAVLFLWDKRTPTRPRKKKLDQQTIKTMEEIALAEGIRQSLLETQGFSEGSNNTMLRANSGNYNQNRPLSGSYNPTSEPISRQNSGNYNRMSGSYGQSMERVNIGNYSQMSRQSSGNYNNQARYSVSPSLSRNEEPNREFQNPRIIPQTRSGTGFRSAPSRTTEQNYDRFDQNPDFNEKSCNDDDNYSRVSTSSSYQRPPQRLNSGRTYDQNPRRDTSPGIRNFKPPPNANQNLFRNNSQTRIKITNQFEISKDSLDSYDERVTKINSGDALFDTPGIKIINKSSSRSRSDSNHNPFQRPAEPTRIQNPPAEYKNPLQLRSSSRNRVRVNEEPNNTQSESIKIPDSQTQILETQNLESQTLETQTLESQIPESLLIGKSPIHLSSKIPFQNVESENDEMGDPDLVSNNVKPAVNTEFVPLSSKVRQNNPDVPTLKSGKSGGVSSRLVFKLISQGFRRDESVAMLLQFNEDYDLALSELQKLKPK